MPNSVKFQQDRQGIHNVTLLHVRANILQWKQQYLLCVLFWVTCHCQLYKLERCTTMILW